MLAHGVKVCKKKSYEWKYYLMFMSGTLEKCAKSVEGMKNNLD